MLLMLFVFAKYVFALVLPYVSSGLIMILEHNGIIMNMYSTRSIFNTLRCQCCTSIKLSISLVCNHIAKEQYQTISSIRVNNHIVYMTINVTSCCYFSTYFSWNL